MNASSPGGNKSGCVRYIILGVIGLFLLFLFRAELGIFWQLTKAVPNLLLNEPITGLPPARALLGVLGFMAMNLIAALSFGYLILFILSGQILPVQNNIERREAYQRLNNFIFGERAPLLMIKEGIWTNQPQEPSRFARGVAIVDPNSAIVLERQWASAAGATANRPQSASSMIRVGGPGLVFIRRGERLRGIVSLRKQFRIALGVLAYTSDGIELKSNVFAMFTLGQPASIIKVAYYGGSNPEDLRVLQIDPNTKQIKSINDGLDADDKAEIHQFAQQYLGRLEPNVPVDVVEKSSEYPPYFLDEKRIFSAVYSQALDVNDKKLETWADLPSLVATEYFRYLISQVTYDSLYSLDDAKRFPLQSEFKPRFARTLRYMGVLSYQFVHRVDGQAPAEGQKVEHRQFRISAVQDLRASKVLRDRGIKVIHAGFSELKPTNPMIAQQRLDNWRARWQQEIDFTNADRDYEVNQIRIQARAEKQQEMIVKLSRILQSSPYSEEALTLRVLQVLDDIASDPNTRMLLPKDTISMLNNIQRWLSPDDKGEFINLLEQNPELEEEKASPRKRSSKAKG